MELDETAEKLVSASRTSRSGGYGRALTTARRALQAATLLLRDSGLLFRRQLGETFYFWEGRNYGHLG